MKMSENLLRVFSKEGNDFEGFKQFFFDYTHGNEVFDEDGNKVTKATATKKINSVMFDILGFDEGYKPTRKEINKAMRKHGIEVMEVIEEAIDFKVETGFHENEFFNNFVEMKNIKQGDMNEFWVDGEDVILSVARVAGDMHDYTMQKLTEGHSFSVATSNYAIKVGMDIDVYLLGRKDWTELVDKIAEAYQFQIQNDLFAAVYNAGSKLPTPDQFVINIEMIPDNKARFDELISDVSMANGNCSVVIMGLQTDLKKLTNFADINWITEDQKRDVAAMGRLGSYEGTDLVEIPQRFAKNDVTKKLIKAGKLFIMPNVDNKFAKFVDVGETEILEVSEKGARRDDFMTYEVQREMGLDVILARYHGEVNIG